MTRELGWAQPDLEDSAWGQALDSAILATTTHPHDRPGMVNSDRVASTAKQIREITKGIKIKVMNQLAPLGRLFFAVSMVAFGVQQFIYGDFVPGRAPAWPNSIPGRLVWAYVSGAILIIAGTAIIFRKNVRWAGLLVGAMIFLWALLRHIPEVAADPSSGAVLTKAGKALALWGGAFAVAGSVPATQRGRSDAGSGKVDANQKLIFIGRFCLGAFMILAGIEHFIFAEFVAPLVPAWIPGSMFWTYFSGVALIAGGAGLILTMTARMAAALTGVMIFLWFVLLHVPRAVSAGHDRNEWIAVFEALAISGIAFVIAGSVRKRESQVPVSRDLSPIESP
ncbi:MAG TPA: hypothetical protein VGV87_24175 [Blastocatellia bacterium]|nr:hypothetical protein [Blastocatellia bacterium]